MAVGIFGEQGVAACCHDGLGNWLAGEQVVAGVEPRGSPGVEPRGSSVVDGPQAVYLRAMGGQPALGGVV
jgi:hypothetical protein